MIPQRKELDQKAATMLEMYANKDFQGPQNLHRLRIQIILWAMKNKLAAVFKRVLDIIGATFLIIVSSPIMLAVAGMIKLTSEGPVIFKQERVGIKGNTFTCYKFRSMYMDAEERKAELMQHNEADGPVFKMKNDPRITPIGRIIRKTSVDEFPQFFNVLQGHMSLVGPRPAIPSEVSEYDFRAYGRLDVAPGITGLQQVKGRSNIDDFDRWIDLDLEYVSKQSLWTDIKILFMTIPAVVFGRGAY